MSRIIVSSIPSLIKLISLHGITISFSEIIHIPFVAHNAREHTENADVLEILRKISNYLNIKLTIANPIIYKQKNFLIARYSLIKSSNIAIKDGDYVSDNLINFLYKSNNNNTNFILFSHGASTYKEFYPGFNPNKSLIKSLYIKLVKPIIRKIKKTFYRYPKKFNYILFESYDNSVKKNLGLISGISNKYNIEYVDYTFLEAFLCKISSIFLPIEVKNIIEGKCSYSIYCPIPEESEFEKIGRFYSILNEINGGYLLIKPHHSDSLNYTSLLNDRVILINKYIPIELLNNNLTHRVYTAPSSSFLHIENKKLRYLIPEKIAIYNLYQKENWALQNILKFKFIYNRK